MHKMGLTCLVLQIFCGDTPIVYWIFAEFQSISCSNSPTYCISKNKCETNKCKKACREIVAMSTKL